MHEIRLDMPALASFRMAAVHMASAKRHVVVGDIRGQASRMSGCCFAVWLVLGCDEEKEVRSWRQMQP